MTSPPVGEPYVFLAYASATWEWAPARTHMLEQAAVWVWADRPCHAY